jgi:hypothetical protein
MMPKEEVREMYPDAIKIQASGQPRSLRDLATKWRQEASLSGQITDPDMYEAADELESLLDAWNSALGSTTFNQAWRASEIQERIIGPAAATKQKVCP